MRVVRDPLADVGRQLMSSSDNPRASLSLWFVADSVPEWVVMAATLPAGEALPPAKSADLRRTFADIRQGVSTGDEPMPLFGGYRMRVMVYGVLEGGDRNSDTPGVDGTAAPGWVSRLSTSPDDCADEL